MAATLLPLAALASSSVSISASLAILGAAIANLTLSQTESLALDAFQIGLSNWLHRLGCTSGEIFTNRLARLGRRC
jgi:hypothetical protein